MKTDICCTVKLLRKYLLALAGWSVLLAASLASNLHYEQHNTLDMAAASARASISKDIIFRKWVASHGGVYVTPSERTPPNPYLTVPDRDILSTKGKSLTLMNPAYALREMQENFIDEHGNKSHIASLKPLNPKNAADAWEAGALASFERGVKELTEVQQIDGQPYMRLMQPFVVEKDCLKCHARQGYKLGDIRGGISTSIPLKTYLAHERNRGADLALSHSVLWLIGLAGLGFSYRRECRLDDESEKLADALRESEARYKRITEGLTDYQYTVRIENGRAVKTTQSPGCVTVTGYTAEEFSADPYLWIQMVVPEDRERVREHVRQILAGKDVPAIEHHIIRKDGKIRWVNDTIILCRDDAGKLLSYDGVINDITERKQAEEQIRNLAFYDVLTQLPNRRMLNDRLGQAMAASKRSGLCGALMFLDLDNFKPLNDTYGHETGDLLLIEVARRLIGCVREMDTVARFGGDEFVVMLSELDADKAESAKQAGGVAEKIRTTLAEPYRLVRKQEGKAEIAIEHHCTSSIGVVLFINHDASPEDIIKWADLAMYQAKDGGRNRVCFYG
ncbi:MAG: diguanylate cyclase [Gallionella sp.]|nr:diguanylate cyclase [Gallionella sp.]